jgi:hypothetical protein
VDTVRKQRPPWSSTPHYWICIQPGFPLAIAVHTAESGGFGATRESRAYHCQRLTGYQMALRKLPTKMYPGFGLSMLDRAVKDFSLHDVF